MSVWEVSPKVLTSSSSSSWLVQNSLLWRVLGSSSPAVMNPSSSVALATHRKPVAEDANQLSAGRGCSDKGDGNIACVVYCFGGLHAFERGHVNESICNCIIAQRRDWVHVGRLGRSV
eukprot:1380886-Ditylum_brightwellii.AAC.1